MAKISPMYDEEGTEYTQCTRCQGWFGEFHIMPVFDLNQNWLADLCKQCWDHWLQFEAFVGDYE